MKRRFSVVYIIAGCAFVWLMSLGGESEIVTLLSGGMALLCFFTAWQGWFNAGAVWKILHITFGVVTVGTCLAAWAYVVPYLTGMSRPSGMGIGEWLAAAAAIILTPPALAYGISAVMWLRSGRKVARAQPAGDAAIAVATPAAIVDAASAKAPQRFARRITVGAVLAALGIVSVLAWVRYGNDVRCQLGTDTACYTAARSAARRGDLDAAVAIYDEVIAREQAKDTPGLKLVSIAWGERDAILIQQGAYARLDAIALEACPDRPVACNDLINVLDKAGQRARAESVFRRYCEMSNGEACASYGKWLVGKGEPQVGFMVLQKHCDTANIMACLEYGMQLAKQRQFDEARIALKRSCVLQAEAQFTGRQPTIYATCQAYMNNEKAFVTPAQLRDDAREICLAYLPQCADVAGVIAYDPKHGDAQAARQMVEESCAKNRGRVPSSDARICDSNQGFMNQSR